MAMPTLNGLVYILGGQLLPPDASWALNLILLLATFIATLVLVRRTGKLSGAFSAAVAAALLLSPHLYLYDYLLLIPPLLLLTGRAQRVFIAVYCLLPFILFAIHALDWLAPMAILPAAILATLAAECFQRMRQSERKKVTPHPLTALE
jgi:hypothetical protein